jgi:hypothetical protein
MYVLPLLPVQLVCGLSTVGKWVVPASNSSWMLGSVHVVFNQPVLFIA